MIRIILLRLLRSLATLLIAVTIVFFFIRLSGDPAEALAPPDAPPEVVQAYRLKLGLDKPLPVQYVSYLTNLAHGDFGYSANTGRPVLSVFLDRLPATLALGGTALIIAVLLGIAIGIIAALNRNRFLDRFVMGFSVFAFAMPNFFFGLIVILVGALAFGLFFGADANGSISFWLLLPPAATLGLSSMGSFARFTRSSLLETLNQPFMRALEARGIPARRRLFRHAAPNAAIPIVTLLGFSIGGIVAGAVVTEQVFAWPGVGQLLVRSVATRDIAMVQFLVLVVAFSMTAANLMVDILYSFLDPRIRRASA
ncbi:ABC transporter permease [Martelella alba]|uniref:ABC transporter permease n=1 Tax=Martelella alba TaxID=2590451 RepID=A0A506U1E3_9HYPH|nr:ABC transporter permease [Martelella alba]TPW26755.1 ABC transporter permease [Martelella alba]